MESGLERIKVLRIGMPEPEKKKRTPEQRISRLEVYVLVVFIVSAIIGAAVLHLLREDSSRGAQWQDTLEKYNNSLALKDSATKLEIANSLRWKHEKDSLDALKAMKQ